MKRAAAAIFAAVLIAMLAAARPWSAREHRTCGPCVGATILIF